ncbi:Translin-associated protein X [Pleurostoma richardsiae]|uniref:Translin-associated protein X n=1 Tax=Pleurostoma richardsiae TaxID=41990 RepID=A0AA38VGP7_9PEZI|nr:Translin-associated protein X [Pleurostoma richardsiae]
MSGQKRDYRGHARHHEPRDRQQHREPPKPRQPTVRNAYTPMFERFRDELDEHHDRRERLAKASRDVTGLSKKIIFSLQRVREIQSDLPDDISNEMQSRLAEAATLLSSVAGELQGINRWRYMRQMSCIEELMEALTFAHYLRTQSLMSFDNAAQTLRDLSTRSAGPDKEDVAMQDDAGALSNAPSPAEQGEKEAKPFISLAEDDYLGGVFDLSGEMMRFATTTAALKGRMAGSGTDGSGRDRTIVVDMQDLGSFFEMLPQQHTKSYQIKMSTLRASVLKVEKLGYGLTVRGSERPKGWMPDTDEQEQVLED